MDLAGIHLPTAASAGTTFAAIQGFFWSLEKIQSRENRRFVARWLLGLTAPDEKWTGIVVEIFHRLFGERHWTPRCFAVSCLTTILALTLMLLVTSAVFLPNVRDNSPVSTDMDVESYRKMAYSVGITYVVAASIFDFISLWVTRLVLYRAVRAGRWLGILAFFFLDLAATTLLFIMAVAASGFAGRLVLLDFPRSIGEFLAYFMDALVGVAAALFIERNTWIDCSYAVSLITSAWLWAYLLIAQFIRLLGYLPPVINGLAKVVDINEHPVRSIGTVIALISAGAVGLLHLL